MSVDEDEDSVSVQPHGWAMCSVSVHVAHLCAHMEEHLQLQSLAHGLRARLRDGRGIGCAEEGGCANRAAVSAAALKYDVILLLLSLRD